MSTGCYATAAGVALSCSDSRLGSAANFAVLAHWSTFLLQYGSITAHAQPLRVAAVHLATPNHCSPNAKRSLRSTTRDGATAACERDSSLNDTRHGLITANTNILCLFIAQMRRFSVSTLHIHLYKQKAVITFCLNWYWLHFTRMTKISSRHLPVSLPACLKTIIIGNDISFSL